MANRWVVQNLTTTDQVTELYVATLGRAPDKGGLAYWVNQVTSGAQTIAQVAEQFFNQSETQAKYPAGTTNSSFVIAVYNNALGRAPDSAGLAYWTAELDAGRTTRANFILAFLQGAYDDPAATPPSFDASLLTNQHIAAEYFAGVDSTGATVNPDAKDFPWTGTDAEKANFLLNAAAVMAPVTADASTIALSKALSDAFETGGGVGGDGQTFTLTVSTPLGKADNLQGTLGNDFFDARLPGSLETGDILTDVGGTDKLEARISAAAVTPTMTGVEEVYIQTTTATASLDLSKSTGYTQLWNQDTGSGNDLAFNNVVAGTTIGLKNIARDTVGNPATTTVNFAAANATTNVVLNGAGVGTTGLYPQLILNSNATTVAINTTGANSRLQDLTVNNLAGSASTLNTLKVEGTANLRIDNVVNFNAATTTGTVDATTFVGALNINLTQAGRDLTVTGGDGNDRFNFGGTLTTADNIKGGKGRDTLAVIDETTIVASLKTESIEIVEVTGLTAASTLNLARVSGADSVVFTVAQGFAATITGLQSNGSVEFQAGNTGVVTATVTGATNAGTNDTLNVVLNHGGTGQNVAAGLAIAGVENVVLSSVKQSATLGDATNTFVGFNAANAPQIQNLTISGNQNLNISGALSPQIKTVNATDFSGDLWVNILGGVTNNGVAITGGSGDDRIIGGSSNDVIVTGNGVNTVRGDALGVVQPGTAQVSSITVTGGPETGDVYSAVIGGNTAVSFTVQGVQTLTAIEQGLIAAINNTGGAGVVGNAATAALVTAADNGTAGDGIILVTEDVNNGGFALTVNAANRQATADVNTVTIAAANFDVGDTISVTINGTAVTTGALAAAGNQNAVATALATAINANGVVSPAVTAAAVGGVVTITGDVVGANNLVTAYTVVDVTLVQEVWTITPADLADAGDTLTVTIGAQNFSALFNASLAQTLTDFVTANKPAIDALTGGSLVTTGTALTITNAAGNDLTGGAISGVITGGDGGTVAVVEADGTPNPNVNAQAATNANIVDGVPTTQGADNTQAVAQATTTPGVAQVLGVGGVDIITLGSGQDAVQIAAGESGYLTAGVIQVDTINNINFGGAGLSTRVDVIDLLSNGPNTGLIADNGDIGTAPAFAGFNVINGGVAQAMVSAPNLTAAVAAIFNAGGALNGQANAAGLFTYGGDNYLVIAGGAAGAYNPADDLVVKLVGQTGTLDSTDFV